MLREAGSERGAGEAFKGAAAWALGAACAAAVAAPAGAQVLEIGDDGAVSVRSGPAVYTPEGVTALVAAAAPQAAAPADAGGVIAAHLDRAAARHALDPRLVRAVAWQESRYNPRAVSPAGAVGVMQLTAAAARDVGVDRFDVLQNIEGGAAYLRRMLDAFGGDAVLALAAYNAGPGAVRAHGGVPPFRETQAYIGAVLGRRDSSPASQGDLR